MLILQFSHLFHFIGVGILSTSLIGGWIIHNAYLRAENLQAQAQLLRVLKPVGLLGPLGILIMLLSGLANLYAYGFEFSEQTFSLRWLMEKLTLFFIVAVIGVVAGIRSAKRGKLVMAMVQGNAPADAQIQKEKFDKSSKIFFSVQAVLFFAILLRAILK